MNKFFLCSFILAFGSVLGSSAAQAEHRDRGRYEYSRHDRCNACGFVERIEATGTRRNSGGGAVAGAIIGGAVGNQVGSGDGRKAATVAGAVIGGIVGNNAERNRSRGRSDYEILVRFDNGGSRWVTQRDLRGVREGDRVKLRNGRVTLR